MFLITEKPGTREQGFLFFHLLPKTGSEQRDRAELKIAFERALDEYFHGEQPQPVKTSEHDRI